MKANLIVPVYLFYLLSVGVNAEAQQLKHLVIESMEAKAISDGITLRSESGSNGTFGYFVMKKGASVPVHSHANEQYSFILKGSVKAAIGDTTMIIKAGETVLIPSNVPHSFTSLEEGTIDLDFFAPRREDWINGTADYFKK
ncbi:cupin domain-containing protein [Dyadobacter pollutisoli]|jgi:quercetin dioxygenase-like cupin family protein|uniref:Cupin domain-containing protein n=1 Tax=Dyadobacter pollutisoli TaxID=2910158 RepID=A0A9E8SQ08_9BACT|nr:cupin domain-containing protein [Dyadobacter pollutisoli]WAC12467.1 cupin domain-containing protein [Dyadobacter pollutisoli]